MRLSLGLWGGRCAWRFGAHRGWREGLAGPAASRPRGRPFVAYAMSCVAMMALSRVGSVSVWSGAGTVWSTPAGYDCGPERSLRTAPGSTSYAFGSLRFPPGASTRPAIPHRPRHALAMRLSLGLWGGRCAWRFGAHRGWREGLAGPAASRPRGRPFAAYAMSCVAMMTLSRVGTAEPFAIDSLLASRRLVVGGRAASCVTFRRVSTSSLAAWAHRNHAPMKHRPHHACLWSAREVVTRNMPYAAPTTTAPPPDVRNH
ncbi:Uncharacterised protein [Achromobacter xylosoxidans]|nr:Uncharacterised protein [Achromobacter xylosoxidans]